MDWKEYCAFDHVFVGLEGDMEAEMIEIWGLEGFLSLKEDE